MHIQESLLPLDNQLRRLIQQRQLRFARTAPFLSSVQRASIGESTIQEREKQNRPILLTQEICTNLRRKLSMLDCTGLTSELIERIQELAQHHGQSVEEELTETLTLQAVKAAETHKLLRYSVQPRMKGEPGNPQIS